MNVLFVTNNINVPGNGICTSVNTTVKHLRDRGIDARFLSGISKDPEAPQPDFPLERLHFPIFQPIIDANGFSYAEIQREYFFKRAGCRDCFHVQRQNASFMLLYTESRHLLTEVKEAGDYAGASLLSNFFPTVQRLTVADPRS